MRCSLKSKNFSAAIFLAAFISGFAATTFACGPNFPNNLLDAGDGAVLQPPIGDFQRELARMKLPAPKARAVSLASGEKHFEQSAEREMTDLAAALKRKKISREQATVIMQAHLAERMKLNSFLQAQDEWARFYCGEFSDTNGYHRLPSTNPPPSFPEIPVTPGLPREFALYFQGVKEWHKGERWSATQTWKKLLALPESERHFKSTWAAFMIARFHQNQRNDASDGVAIKDFEQVRALAKMGFADSSGLAVASIGEEAKIFLRQKNFERAIELYLEQFAASDDTAVESLRFSAAHSLAETNSTAAELKRLAQNPLTRRVITAYLISRHPYDERSETGTDANGKEFFDRTDRWLAVVEAAGVKDLESAETLALAAYQSGNFAVAQRWINRSGDSAVAQWLQAKLFLHDGKVDVAAKLLAQVSRKFPQELPGTNPPKNFAQSLFVDMEPVNHEPIAIGRQSLGELGVLHLARREYSEALDALLRSGYWMDAAYVAERVLTVDELKISVDRNWPAADANKKNSFEDRYDWRRGSTTTGEQIRYLLARRLARDARFAEARNYFPEEWKPRLDALTDALKTGRDASRPFEKRADVLLAAAALTRTNGIELLGTELQPDWFIYAGNFECGVTWEARDAGRTNANINVATLDEIERAQAHHADPEERWHYRDRARDLKTEAAKVIWIGAGFLPDNSAELVHALVRGGTLCRSLDRESADKFFQMLVRRCGKTLIGQQADKLRWFPEQDANGNLKQVIPWIDQVELTAEWTNAISTNGVGQVFYRYPTPGNFYVVQPGDTFSRLARAASKFGQPVTLKQIMEANPRISPTKLHIGQLLVIPAAVATQPQSPR